MTFVKVLQVVYGVFGSSVTNADDSSSSQNFNFKAPCLMFNPTASSQLLNQRYRIIAALLHDLLNPHSKPAR